MMLFQVGTGIDPTALLNAVPSLAEAVLFAVYARDMQQRNNAQMEKLLALAEDARTQQRTDFLAALQTEQTERRADNGTYQAALQSLGALVSATNALVAQHDAASRARREDFGKEKPQ